jgi:hypothetical protein
LQIVTHRRWAGSSFGHHADYGALLGDVGAIGDLSDEALAESEASAKGGSRRYFFLVLAAFLAARDRAALDRLLAAVRVCLDNALRDPAARPSRFSARVVARERFREGDLRLLLCARFVSREAFRRVASDPVLGGGSFTPARRALDKAIAIACRADRAPCLPWRTCSISSRTNSPACVEGALPSRSASWARSTVSSSGIARVVRISCPKWSCRSHSSPRDELPV